ncbi:MAG: hypothetical protein R2911_19470 [Caldilineaceae bacterium]
MLWGLWNAQAWAAAQSAPIDFVISDTNLNLAVEYLNSHFQAPKDITERWQLNEMAFTLYVLAEMGQGDPGHCFSTLYDERDRLALYGQAYLAMALHDMQESADAANPQVNTLKDNLFGRPSSRPPASIGRRARSTTARSTPIRAPRPLCWPRFARIAPEEPLLPNVVRWLMDARKVAIGAQRRKTPGRLSR